MRPFDHACVLATGIMVVAAALSPARSASAESWFLDDIRAPSTLEPIGVRRPIVIAIVDDAFRLTHRDLQGFVWSNPDETPHNLIDDDGNGYIDDVHGWDVSDGDNDVAPPREREEFYHGTHIAGIVTQIARRAYGERASDLIRILPIKSLSDRAKTTHLKEAYAGIEYAIAAGADIIVCSWGVGAMTQRESQILKKAEEKGILIVASAGNLPEEREQFPAAYRTVVAVGALDREGRKLTQSNFGQFLDLSAPGIDIGSASASSDDGYDAHAGTSFSTPMVATAAALIKLHHPDFGPREIEACLKSSASVIENVPRRYRGKIGAGKLNVESAIECSTLVNGTPGDVAQVLSKGYLRPSRSLSASVSWRIEPAGEFKSLLFRPVFNRGEGSRGVFEFREGTGPGARVVARHSLELLPGRIQVPGSASTVTFVPADGSDEFDWLLEYEAETIDFTKVHCSGTTELTAAGTLSDGSGPEPYSFNSNCKWLITAPAGKVVHFEFTALDTEAQTDLIYFFDGSGTNEKIMAIFSGSNLPPELTSWRRQVLVWFVTNGETQGQGWQAEYSFRDD